MLKELYLAIALLLISGCSVLHSGHNTEEYESSSANCSENGSLLYCDWNNVTDDWITAKYEFRKDKNK